MSEQSSPEPSRRAVIRGGAIGAGALLGAIGLGAGTASAATSPAAREVVGQDPALGAAATGDRVFLKLDGIAGESTLKGLEDWIELSDFSWGAQDTAPSRGARGRGAGRVRALDVAFSAPTSKASPQLLGSAVTGKVISSGQVVVTRPAEAGLAQFIKYDLSDVVIDFYKIDTAAAGQPSDTGGLTFQRIKFSYYPQDPRGGLEAPVTMEWDTRSYKA